MSEFCLSDKMCKEIEGIKLCPPVLTIIDVKEFIKELKKEFKIVPTTPNRQQGKLWNSIQVRNCLIIDKLAGEGLIEDE